MQSTLFDLTGKTAIVTGGSMGIGQRLVNGLAEHGANVVIGDIDQKLAEKVAGEVEAHGGKALAIKTDVCNPDDVDRLVLATTQQFGAVDILVNNVGGTGGGSGLTETLPLERWRRTMDLTVTSAFLCSQRVGRVMIGQNRGKIINIASVYGLVGQDSSLYDLRPDGLPSESLDYAAGKGAIVNMTRALAVYWARYGINVNAVAPGMVKTERLGASISAEAWERLSRRTPLKRPAKPEDMAGAVIYLSSPAADFVTGHILVVDGGWQAW